MNSEVIVQKDTLSSTNGSCLSCQSNSLSWIVQKETSSIYYSGGILADMVSIQFTVHLVKMIIKLFCFECI
jgi:hypothetical protein